MKHYELTCLISPDLSDEEQKVLSKKITGFISEEEGSLEKITEPYKKKLGYFIKKRKEAFLVSLNFHLDPGKLKNLEKKIKVEKQIIRYFILFKREFKRTSEEHRSKKLNNDKILKDLEKLSPVPVMENSTENKESATVESNEIRKDKPLISKTFDDRSKKVELKEIDKKIEEILNE